MRKIFNPASLGIGAALMVLCAFTPASRATVIVVDNLTSTTNGASVNTKEIAQGFNSTVSGQISSVTVEVNILATTTPLQITIYDYTTAGGPTGSGTLLGTISSLAVGLGQQLTLSGASLANFSLVSGDGYAIGVNNTSGAINFVYANTASNTGTDSISDHPWSNSGTGWSEGSSAFSLISVSVVPEPTNYALAGFGLVFVGVGAGRFYLARRRSTTAG